MSELELRVPAETCEHCGHAIGAEPPALAAVEDLDVDAATGRGEDERAIADADYELEHRPSEDHA